MTHTSSAVPAALQQYAETEQQRADALRHEARLLAAALDHFAATCTEFPTRIDGALADPLNAHARLAAEHAQWVRRVGAAFLQADGGALTPAPHAPHAPHAPPLPAAGAARAAPTPDDLAAWGAHLSAISAEIRSHALRWRAALPDALADAAAAAEAWVAAHLHALGAFFCDFWEGTAAALDAIDAVLADLDLQRLVFADPHTRARARHRALTRAVTTLASELERALQQWQDGRSGAALGRLAVWPLAGLGCFLLLTGLLAAEVLLQILGFLEGMWLGLVETVTGIATVITDLVKLSYDEETRQRYHALIAWFQRDARGAAGAVGWAIVEPIVADWNAGHYGRAIGRVAFEALPALLSGGTIAVVSKSGKIGALARALKAGATVEKLLEAGATVDELLAAGAKTDELYDLLGNKHGVSPQLINDLKASGHSPAYFVRLIDAGFSPEQAASITRHGPDAVSQAMSIAERLRQQGIDAKQACSIADRAAEVNRSADIDKLIASGRLKNPAGLEKFLKEWAANNAGMGQALDDALARIRGGSDILLEDGRADLIDLTRREAVQHKEVIGASRTALFNNLRDAAAQLRGATGELPPAGFERVAEVRLTNESNPFFNADRSKPLEMLRETHNHPKKPNSLDGIDKLTITNGKGTFTFTADEFRAPRADGSAQ